MFYTEFYNHKGNAMQNTAIDQLKNSWLELSTMEQLTNIGCEINKAIDLRRNHNQFKEVIEEALKLLELTIIDPKNVKRLREIIVVKQLVIDDFFGKNEFQSTDEAWHKYFAFFERLVKNQKEDQL